MTEKRPLARRPVRPERVLALGFLCAIIMGAGLLALPACSANGRSLGLLRALFTATSSVCVTGLSLIEAGRDLSMAGQVVLLMLIQLGGLGFMAFATLIVSALGKKMSLRSRMILRDSMNQNTLSGTVRLSLTCVLITFVIEAAGALVLMLRLVPLYGAKGVWYSLFTAVSAFCNAGFDVFGTGASLVHLSGESTVLMTIAVLIVLGGLGFPVILECLHHRFRWRAFSLHAKMVLTANLALWLFGMVSTLALEWRNPATLGALGFADKAVNSLFQSVTLRTAGFASLDQAALTDASKLVSLPLMFIGASSASTGGGVKTTTAAVLLLVVISVIRGRSHITAFGRELNPETARRAMAITFIALAMAACTACAISVIEQNRGFDMIDLLFEAVSAFSTAGVSAAGTARLHPASQWLLMGLMYLGRVGPLTLALALANRMENVRPAKVRYPEEKIMIG